MSRFLLALCAVLVAGKAQPAVSPTPQTLFFEAKLKSRSFGDMGVRRMWIKGNHLRWESNGGKLNLIVVKNAQGVFLLHPFRNEAAKYPPGSIRENPGCYIPGPTGSVRQFLAYVKATRCGREKVENEYCDVYSYTHPIAKRACKLWVSTKSGKPVKLLLPGKRGKLDTITAYYTRFEPGAAVSDSRFELPKGCAVRAMPKRAEPDRAVVKKPNSYGAG